MKKLLWISVAVALCAVPCIAQSQDDPRSVFPADAELGIQRGLTDDGKPNVVLPPPPGGQPEVVGALLTTFASDNGFRGNMFDVQPNKDLRLVGLSINVDAPGTATSIDVWYRPGTSFGFENSSAGWSLLASGTGISAGQDNATFIDLSTNGVVFEARQSYGLYVDLTSYPTQVLRYTNGGPTAYSNTDIALLTNVGKGDPAFTGGTFTFREWNGILWYSHERAESVDLSENFEFGDLSHYTATGLPSGDVSAAGAHDGEYGLVGPVVSGGFHYRTDVVTAPGNSYSCFVRLRGANVGRAYVGVAASAGGTYSMVFAPNTGEIVLQDNTGYGFVNLAVTPFVPATGRWYVLQLDWSTQGDMSVSIWDETHTTLLAQTAKVATAATSYGGLAVRAFGTDVDLDSIGAPPCTGSEDFEHNDLSYYSIVGPGGDLVLTGAAAHDGSYGAQVAGAGASWYYRTDVVTSPGNTYRAFVRRTDVGGRIYVGVAAGPGGAYSAVLAPNTGNILLQNNTGYGFIDLAAAPIDLSINTWYQLELYWAANGDMTVSLWNEKHTVRLAQTATAATGVTTPGGIALRGFVNSDIDTIGSPPSIARADNLDHGLESLYARSPGTDDLTFTPQAAHDGALGASFGNGNQAFFYRTDVTTSPGNSYRAFVRSTGGDGRAYIGVGATPTGSYSMVAGFNSGTIVLQDNSGWGFTDLASTPFAFAVNTWYQLELDWSDNGDMRVRLYDEAGGGPLASTALVATGLQVPGGISLRGFGTAVHVDTYSEPAPIHVYCVAKTGACGVPAIRASGRPSASATSGFVISASPARSVRTGILLYSEVGRLEAPFSGGTLCIRTPLSRGGPVLSGGTPGPNCDGVFSLDMNEFASGNYVPGFPTHTPKPFLLVIGRQVNVQWWGRDTVATGAYLSDALEYCVGP